MLFNFLCPHRVFAICPSIRILISLLKSCASLTIAGARSQTGGVTHFECLWLFAVSDRRSSRRRWEFAHVWKMERLCDFVSRSYRGCECVVSPFGCCRGANLHLLARSDQFVAESGGQDFERDEPLAPDRSTTNTTLLEFANCREEAQHHQRRSTHTIMAP